MSAFFPVHKLSEPARLAVMATQSRLIQVGSDGSMYGAFVTELADLSPSALAEVSRLVGKLAESHQPAFLTIPRAQELETARHEWEAAEQPPGPAIDAASIYAARRPAGEPPAPTVDAAAIYAARAGIGTTAR